MDQKLNQIITMLNSKAKEMELAEFFINTIPNTYHLNGLRILDSLIYSFSLNKYTRPCVKIFTKDNVH